MRSRSTPTRRSASTGSASTSTACWTRRGRSSTSSSATPKSRCRSLLSNRGYGFLWNMPGVGRVELGANRTRWVADAARQIDYWVTTGPTPAEIVSRYARVTGLPPMLPEWASGFWQSKLRYRNQDELLEVAREYKRRGLPLSVIVCDYFHWTRQGEWRFDPAEWPDPQAMVDELRELGVELMVSVWPTVNPNSENYAEMDRRGFLVRNMAGLPLHISPSGTRAPTARPSCGTTTRPTPRPAVTSGRRSRTAIAATASGRSGSTHANRRSSPRTPRAPGTSWAKARRCRASIPGSMPGASTRGCGRAARTTCCCSADPPGRAASATGPPCGRATSTPPSRLWPRRSRPA